MSPTSSKAPEDPRPPPKHKHACSLCARRKVKCDKGDPCSNCLKGKAQCLYEAPVPPLPRKRAADEDLLTRLAQYEDLMRQHNIDFTHHANVWIPSGLEVKPEGFVSSVSTESVPYSRANAPGRTTRHLERCLWSSLSSELKYPPTQVLRHPDDPYLHPTPPLYSLFSSDQPPLHELHPEPRLIFRLWQTFVQSIHPMTKIVHAPTLQQRILDASWDTTSIPSPLAAIMFVIYLLSVTNMPSSDYEASFNESRTTVMLRYRTATVRALMEADFLQTKDLEVLQALVLFLFADPESDLTLTMTAIAVKIGFNIGLHRECEPKVSLFEQEMRIRLWLQLRGIEYRSHSVSMSWPNRMRSELDAHRLPLNVNDTELHPDMTDLPVEHTGPTEMLCVLMKFAVPNWFRTSPLGAKLFERIRCHSRDSTSPEEDSAAIDELQELYRKKFLSNLDDRIPLHGLAMTIAARSIAAMRFKINHPRGKAGAKEGDVYMTRGELDMLFDSAVTSLDLKKASVEPGFAVHLLTPMTSKFELDSYIYILSDLRERCSGDRVALAWRIIGDLYSGHPELISDTDNTFYVALGDLTLEAWEARSKELQGGRDMREFDLTPPFIQALWDKRRDKNRDNVQAPSDLDPYAFGTMDGYYDLDWVYWNNFLRI